MKKLLFIILTLFITTNVQAQESIYDKEIHELFGISSEDLEYSGVNTKDFHLVLNENNLQTYTVFKRNRVSYVKIYSNDFEYIFVYDHYVKLYFLIKQCQ
jgi:hypothetical protein